MDRRVKRAIEIIETDFAELRSIPQLARRLNMSERTLQRLFKRDTGTTPRSHLRRTRLERARELVVQTDEQVAQIAYRVGFSDPQEFSRVFREIFGKSATRLRKELQPRD